VQDYLQNLLREQVPTLSQANEARGRGSDTPFRGDKLSAAALMVALGTRASGPRALSKRYEV
jgi:hypothetical protein